MVAPRKHSAGSSTSKARHARLHLVADLSEADANAVRAAADALIDTGLTCKQAAHLLGVREQAITAKIDEGKLIGLKRGREWRLPAWQFIPDDASIPRFDTLQAVFPGGPVSLSAWMNKPSIEFDGRTPLQEIVAHGPDGVVAHAQRLTAAAW